ncbi:MAG: OmpA family protein [Bacteroidetes bacterium]|nr:OmpA family protein [Bacteroidota bacterium]
MKKTFITALILCIAASSVVAQQIPLSSSTYFMRLLNNPALTGYNGSTNAYAYFRDQWTGMPGHPITMGGMGEVSLWKEQSNIGFHVYNDVTSIISNVGAQVYYAQKIKLAKDHSLAVGLSLGILNTHIDYNNAIANDPNDANLLTATKSGTGFDMNVGIAYQWKKKLTIGFAIPHVAQTNVVLADQTKKSNYLAVRNYVAHASYEISFDKAEKWNLEPSILFKKASVSKLYQFDGNLMANWKRFLYLGVGYRQDYGMSFTGGIRIAQCVTVAYTYEYPLGMPKGVTYGNTKGTHEIILGINFDKWIKGADKMKKRMDTIEKRVDNVEKLDTVLSQKMDSVAATNADMVKKVDEVKQENKAQDEKIAALTTRVDTLENQMADYKKRIAEKTPGNFSSMTDADRAKLKAGDVIKLDKVYFETNSSYLKTESYAQLDKLAGMLKASPDMKVRVLGHTDITASDAYNMWLSERRAKHVADYLISKGVAADRITSVGYGKRAPVADNSTEEGRALNRRVEIDLIKK